MLLLQSHSSGQTLIVSEMPCPLLWYVFASSQKQEVLGVMGSCCWICPLTFACSSMSAYCKWQWFNCLPINKHIQTPPHAAISTLDMALMWQGKSWNLRVQQTAKALLYPPHSTVQNEKRDLSLPLDRGGIIHQFAKSLYTVEHPFIGFFYMSSYLVYCWQQLHILCIFVGDQW